MLSLFLYHQMRPLSLQEELHVISNLVICFFLACVPFINNGNFPLHQYGGVNEPLHKVVEVAHHLRNSSDQTVQSLASSLSTRQLLRVARRMKSYPDENVYDAIQRACLARYL
jgi:von Willebrand factor A domain-containing protein 8